MRVFRRSIFNARRKNQCHKVHRRKFGAVLLAVALGAAPVFAKAEPTPQEGTSVEELAALKARPLPVPSKVKVAILPFTDSTGSIAQLRMGTVANYLLWQREGFQMLPVLKGFKALTADEQIEPGLPLRRTDAARLGKKLGADWVVYGDVKQLTSYHKDSFFKSSKYLLAGIRIVVVEVKSGETLYWHSRVDKTGGKSWGGGSSAVTLKRRGAIIVSLNALQPLFDALPPHATLDKKTLDSVEVADMMEQLWPGDKNNQ